MSSVSAQTLHRAIRLPHATAMVIGTIIGASIFIQPSEVTSRVPSVPGVLAVWLVAGLLSLVGALVCAELASTFTRSGGVYVYLREIYGAPIGFLWGWAMFWSVHSGIIAVVAMVCARYASHFAPFAKLPQSSIAIAVILVLSIVNYLGVRLGAAIQSLFTWGKLLAIAVIVGLGFTLGSRLPSHFQPIEGAGPIGLGDFVTALVAGLFAFGGWHLVTYNAGETREPQRTIPRALMLGTVVVTMIYLAMNAVYLYVLPLATVASSERVAADAAEAVLGIGGGSLLAGLVVFSTFGALNGIVLSGPRVYYAMARDGLLFRWLAAVHPRHRTPHRAIALQCLWSSVLVLTGTYRALFTRVIYTEWIFFGLLGCGLVLLRRRQGLEARPLERGYAIWGYPWLPVGFAAVSFSIVAHQMITDPMESALGLGLVLIGLPVFWLWTRGEGSR